jgi:hypothetical protein
MKIPAKMNKKNRQLLIISSFIAATVTTILMIKKKKTFKNEKPPRKAPQLNIENPGSQHDFPKPPMESELG